MNDIVFLKNKNEAINLNLTTQINSLKQPIKYKVDGKNDTKDVKELHEYAKKNQVDVARQNEKNKRKFKLLQKYQYALEDIAKLLDIIPTNYDNLSLENLTKELEDLINARNKNMNQINFSFCQNMFSKLLSDLTSIENDYQDGKLSAADALGKAKSIKKELASNKSAIPAQLFSTQDELSYLIDQYIKGFDTAEKISSDSLDPVSPAFGLNTTIKISFETLNAQTEALSARVGTLTNNLSNFQPVVNLDELYKQLESTDEVFADKNWKYDDASSKVADLTRLSKNMFIEQTNKNNENKRYESEIKSITNDVENLSRTSIRESAKEVYVDTKTRSSKISEQVEEIKYLADGNNSMPEDIAKQFSRVINEQIDADEANLEEVQKEDDAKNEISKDVIEAARNSNMSLEEYIAELELQRNPDFTKPYDEDDNK